MSDVRRIGFTELSGSKDVTRGPYRVNIIFAHGLRPSPTNVGGRASTRREKHDDEEQAKGPDVPLPKQVIDHNPDTPAGESSSSARLFWPNDFLTRDIPNARHGQELANQIELELGNEDPIVFVAHSLGGILVKDAIRRSEICRARTKLVVFLGTPHRGSQSTGWGELAANMAQLALQDSNKTIIETLEVNSEVLDIIHELFITIVLEDKLQVYSFQEA